MGVFERAEQFLKSNVNALLDKMEDPEKMIDQVILDLADNLDEVKQKAAAVIAEKARTGRIAENNKKEIAKYDELARKALASKNEEHARTFLTRKGAYVAKMPEIEKLCTVAEQNADKVRAAHDKLVFTIEELKSRRAMIKAKIKLAQSQDLVSKVSSISSSINSKEAPHAAYEQMEEKADTMLDKSNALAELNAVPPEEVETLEDRYGAGGKAAVEEELQKLKREMGLE